jgi:UDP-N-acetylglucosamine--N-acetylmuramyl-(pentapeptide) pyrophosphoryl-undecaprenol N-acetylglucosamine transferase
MSGHIVIMAGGTGGHVFPALAVAQEMQQRGWKVSWLGTEKGLEYRVATSHGIEIDCVTVEGIRGKRLFSKLTGFIKLILACFQTKHILQDRKPNVVLGMGGFVAGPGGLMAKVQGIPLVIHEQNRIPGTTNRLLIKFAANKILEGFPHSFSASVKAICTGNPLRKTFSELPEKIVWYPQIGRHLRILVIGGSQGAKVLNENIPDALAGFEDIEIKHQTGVAMYSEVVDIYQKLGMSAEVSAFIEDMSSAYQWADLIICRAGAMTVSEVASCGLPAIFVPLQNAIDDHQTANAKFLTEAGGAILLPQPELNPETMRKVILEAKASLAAMSKIAKSKARPDAAREIADICILEAAG